MPKAVQSQPQPSAALSLSGIATNVSCFGGSNGTINLTVTGGTAPYTFDWAHIPGTNNIENLSNLTAGTYSVIVTDANGCTTQQSFNITQPPLLTLSVSVTQPTCPTAPFNGAINLTVTGGTAPYSYSWSDMSGSPQPENRSGIGPGNYSVTVTDANGCTATISTTLINTLPLPGVPSGINH
jgi:hypothetical protein